jgi:hypothetical protein
MALIFTRSQFEKNFRLALRERTADDIIITQCFADGKKENLGEFAYLNKAELLIQLRFWKNQKCFSRACNIREQTTPCGQTCWLFVIQMEDEEQMTRLTGIPLASFFCGMLVSGLPYITFDKSVIDLVQRYIGRD